MVHPSRTSRPVLPARVRSVADVSDSMRQIELAGPDFARLRDRPGAHRVVRVPTADGFTRRVYSIWDRVPGSATITIRVALHPAGGPGCVWALGVTPGDRVAVEPPRSKITLDEAAGFHLFVGDETAAVPLLSMCAAARGAVSGVFEAAGPGDEVPGVAGVPPLPWVHRGAAPATASPGPAAGGAGPRPPGAGRDRLRGRGERHLPAGAAAPGGAAGLVAPVRPAAAAVGGRPARARRRRGLSTVKRR